MSSKLNCILAFAQLGIPILPLAPEEAAPAVGGGAKAGVTDVMLLIRRRSLLPEHAFFSSGNDLDQMFIQLKPGFKEQVENSKQISAEMGAG